MKYNKSEQYTIQFVFFYLDPKNRPTIKRLCNMFQIGKSTLYRYKNNFKDEFKLDNEMQKAIILTFARFEFNNKIDLRKTFLNELELINEKHRLLQNNEIDKKTDEIWKILHKSFPNLSDKELKKYLKQMI